jgi:hypothetical protein
MVGNEEHIILRMLESCYKYIDYWVIQCNGNDKTQDIITKFLTDKQIPGFSYKVDWKYPGWNRDHALQECLGSNHGCDWILRIDADEQLIVDDDFDWSMLDDTSIDSWNITAEDRSSTYGRTWLWNAKLSWQFQHDKRHEIILLPPVGEYFNRVDLPFSFRHLLTADGKTWDNPTKFFEDAIELEKDNIVNNTLLEDDYHFFYTGKSYFDCYQGNEEHPYPLGLAYCFELGRRAIFYFTEYIKFIDPQFEQTGKAKITYEPPYYACFAIGEIYRFMGNKTNIKDIKLRTEYFKLASHHYKASDSFCPNRNEHLLGQAEVYLALGYTNEFNNVHPSSDICFTKARDALKYLLKPERKSPYPKRDFLLHNHAYYDKNDYIKNIYSEVEAKISGVSVKLGE